LVFHTALAVVVLYFAAQTKMAQDFLKKIGVEMVKKEKPPEKKEPEKPKEEPPKEAPKIVSVAPRIAAPTTATPPPTGSAPPAAAAPPAIDTSSFFSGKEVNSVSDPVQVYKGLVEYSLRSRWNRPDDMDDHDFVAEVEIEVDRSGRISNSTWSKGSGNTKWDDSVRQAIAQVKSMSKPPPPAFPGKVKVRFDVMDATPIVP